MNRRHMISAAAALPGCAMTARVSPPPRGPIVLVHGAWHGGWCWRDVVPPLIAAGHTVHVPTLTGLGDRRHLARPGIDLELHARDLQALFEMEDLNDVTLVGHSYAGFIISLLAERARARLRRLVYLDAFVPENGKCVLDYIHPPQRRQALLDSGVASGFAAPVPLAALGVVKPEDLRWVQPRIVPQPFETFRQPIALSRPAGEGLPRTYIACTSPPSGSFGQFAERVKTVPGWDLQELATGHDAMVIAPSLLAESLLLTASQPA
jgi:pimeloyl-ACP methyl ester carboxylesterase